MFVAFVWLNSIIAKEIYKRRHAPVSQIQSKSERADDEDSSTAEMKNTDETNTSSNAARNHPSKISSRELKNAVSSKPTVFTVQTSTTTQPNSETHRGERHKRQLRMFKVILVLMTVFIGCRLPTWLFLLYKLSFDISGRLNWLIQYGFGAMGILNCMLNPLLYQFLGETIRITSHIGSACYKFCRLCRRTKKTTSHYANNQTMYAANAQPKSDGGIYLGS
jgi:Fe2+ transport system protein B